MSVVVVVTTAAERELRRRKLGDAVALERNVSDKRARSMKGSIKHMKADYNEINEANEDWSRTTHVKSEREAPAACLTHHRICAQRDSLVH